MSILVIDDDSEARSLLSRILSDEGFEGRFADCGDLALASLAVNRPELILVDLRMPGMDGLEVCRRLKQRADSRDIPVIVLSGSGDLADRIEAFRLGAVDFISKPFQREELLARVRTHVELSKLRQELEERVAIRTAQLRESEELFNHGRRRAGHDLDCRTGSVVQLLQQRLAGVHGPQLRPGKR